MPLTIKEALAVIESAHRHAAEKGWRVTVAVVDEGGLLKALGRMDGATPLGAQIAEAKAVGAALWLRNGDSLAQVQKDRPAFFDAVSSLARLPILPTLGSTLIQRDGSVLGAVGVSGATPEQDLECAEAGLRELPPS